MLPSVQGCQVEVFYTVSGFLVGTVVGITGVGGGALMTPLLVLVFGVAPATAVATDLLYAAATKSGGTWLHMRRGGVDWPLVGRLAAGSVPASLVTLAVLQLFTEDRARLNGVVSVSLGVALVLTAGALLCKDRLGQWAQRARPGHARPARGAVVASGAALGALVTVSSVGAGALGVAALGVLAPGMAAARIVGTDIAHAVPLTLVAGLGHAASGPVDWRLLGSLLVGSLPGIWLGSAISHQLPERRLRALLAFMLILIGARLAW
jgi:uncharacterized membrane protein YfcA